jgi:malate dehydrogenase (oxaloacetate-decarboxylating)
MVNAGLSETEARRRFYAVDRDGLLVEGLASNRAAQGPFIHSRSDIAGWKLQSPGTVTALDVMINAKPTTLIGVSGQQGTFTEEIVRAMAQTVKRPVIFPLSNPTSRCEARPEDLMRWTDGRALIGTGSPFEAVNWQGRKIPVDQTNNSYIFPGVGLGILSVKARRVTDSMFMAAAQALADLSPAKQNKSECLLPPVTELRNVSVAVAEAVARQAIKDGVADDRDDDVLKAEIRANVWEPTYLPYKLMSDSQRKLVSADRG